MAPCNGTLQWHHVHPPKVGRHPPPNHSTLQWHPAMAPLPAPTIAHYNGTVQWHHVHSPKLVVTLPRKNSTLQWHSNGTTSSAPCNGTLVPRPIRQSGSSPSPPIGSKNPYSYRYLGKNGHLGAMVSMVSSVCSSFVSAKMPTWFPWHSGRPGCLVFLCYNCNFCENATSMAGQKKHVLELSMLYPRMK